MISLPNSRRDVFTLGPFRVEQIVEESSRFAGWDFAIFSGESLRAMMRLGFYETEQFETDAELVQFIDRRIYECVKEADMRNATRQGRCVGQIPGFPGLTTPQE